MEDYDRGIFSSAQSDQSNIFPQTRFSEAKLGPLPPMYGEGSKKNLLNCCKWRVGDGKAINIWPNYWLPGHRLIPKPILIDEAAFQKVECLIDAKTRWWNVDKVISMFSPCEAGETGEVLKVLPSAEN